MWEINLHMLYLLNVIMFYLVSICNLFVLVLISVTSSSVWVNLPVAASLIIGLRYLSLDFDMRRKAATYNSNLSSANTLSQKKPLEHPKNVEKSEWRRKVNSPVVEDAIDHFTRHLVSEWMTDLWYSRLTPDKEGPEELLNIMNSVLGEISERMRNINLIDLLTRFLFPRCHKPFLPNFQWLLLIQKLINWGTNFPRMVQGSY